LTVSAPALSHSSLPREPGWRPLFGQSGAAQGHLRNQHVNIGDVFLFFGLFDVTGNYSILQG